jgi:hypothetical protein
MELTVSELVRLLEYIPKDTAPDLHRKVVARLVAMRYYEVGRYLHRGARTDAQEEFIFGLTEYERWCYFYSKED